MPAVQKRYGITRVPAWDALRSAFQSIMNHKMRSLLTLTGIVIGVLAVVSMFSSVYALKHLISKNMEGMGWDLSVVIAADTPDQVFGHRSRRRALRRAEQSVRTISYDDYLALKSSLPHKSSYAMIMSTAVMKLGNKDKQVQLRATDGGVLGRLEASVRQQRVLPCLLQSRLDHRRLFQPLALIAHHEALEGIAAMTELTRKELERLTGRIDGLHIVGGGVKNQLLCQLIADFTGLPVTAGPVEGTAIGNIIVQMLALGELRDPGESIELLKRSFEMLSYEPRNS